MTVDAADIKTRFPEFGSLDAATITRWLEEAERHHSVCQWGGKSDDGLAYLTAHLLLLFGAGDCSGGGQAAAGPLASSTEGRVSASWAVPAIFSQDDLGSTVYGRRYLSMVRTLFTCRCT